MIDPRKARVIGYIILFASFPFFGTGAVMLEIWGGVLSMLLFLVGAVLVTVSVIWMIRKVRCPHCGALLHLKLYDISRCPYCNKSTDPDSRE